MSVIVENILDRFGAEYIAVMRTEIAHTALPKETKVHGTIYSVTIAHGNLNKSMVSEVVKVPNGYRLDFIMMHYAKFLLQKVYPKVPIQALLDWMRAKGIEQDKSEKEQTSIAWAIHMSLKDRSRPDGGTVPMHSDFPFVHMDTFLERVSDQLSVAMAKEFEFDFEDIFDDL